MTEKRYTRTKERFSSASEAWADVEERVGLTFDQVVRRDHDGNDWAWIVEVDDGR